MRLVKRTAITLKPKQPYFDWANHLDDGPKIDAEASSEASIYLVEDDSDFEFDLEALLNPVVCENSRRVQKLHSQL